MERNISSVSGIENWSKDAALRNSGQHGMNGGQGGIVGDLEDSVG
jgi:hypothetical protein